MYLLLLAGCPLPEKPEDTGDTGDSAADTDVVYETGDTDEGVDCLDTAVGQFYFLGEFNTSAGEYVDATFGYGVYGFHIEDWACRTEAALPYEGPAPEGCPDCDWAFDLGPATGSTVAGDYCDGLGWSDGWLDSYVDYSWGFASLYYYDYGGSSLPLENTLFLNTGDGAGWFVFSFNYGGRDWMYGDAEHVELFRPVSGPDYYYYYYYPC